MILQTIITVLGHLFEIRATLCLVDTCTAVQTFVNFYFNKIDLENFSLSYLIQIDKVDVGSELFITQVWTFSLLSVVEMFGNSSRLLLIPLSTELMFLRKSLRTLISHSWLVIVNSKPSFFSIHVNWNCFFHHYYLHIHWMPPLFCYTMS